MLGYFADKAQVCRTMFCESVPLLYDLDEVKRLAAHKQVPLYTYPGCNHSLECSSWKRNMEILGKVMELTETYVLEWNCHLSEWAEERRYHK